MTKTGAGQSPIYANVAKQAGELPNWSFSKYLIDRSGRVVEFYGVKVTPEDAALRKDIEAALGG